MQHEANAGLPKKFHNTLCPVFADKIEKKWLLIALLVISTILSVIGVGLLIALAVVVSHGK